MSEFVSIEPSQPNPYSSYYNGAAASNKSKLKFAIIGGLLVVAIVSAVAVAIVTNSNSGGEDDGVDTDQLVADYVDPGEVDETLNSHLAELVATAPHTNYSVLSAQTPYFDTYNYLLPTTKESGFDSQALAYSAAFSILKQQAVNPDEQIAESADEYNITVKQVPVVNSKALNYYLDQKSVVIFHAKGKEPFTQDGKWVLVYAGQPELGLYNYYTSGQLCEGCEAPFVINKLQLFSALESDEQFYILSNTTGETE